MRTHDYRTNRWGHAIHPVHVLADGKYDICGHGEGVQSGDEILVSGRKSFTTPQHPTLYVQVDFGRISRLRLDEVEYFRDPPDMWSAVAYRREILLASAPFAQWHNDVVLNPPTDERRGPLLLS